jgi:hypothetical protein
VLKAGRPAPKIVIITTYFLGQGKLLLVSGDMACRWEVLFYDDGSDLLTKGAFVKTSHF